jgi:hypothetical protein
MNGDLALEVQAAIFAAISNDSSVRGIVQNRIFDHVPQIEGREQTKFPFLQIGDAQFNDWGDKSEPGQIGTFSMNAYSRERSNEEALKIRRACVNVLHQKPVPMEEGQMVMCRFEYSNLRMLSDGVTRTTSFRFRIIISENPTTNPT